LIKAGFRSECEDGEDDAGGIVVKRWQVGDDAANHAHHPEVRPFGRVSKDSRTHFASLFIHRGSPKTARTSESDSKSSQ
jgi:hypothetical protein